MAEEGRKKEVGMRKNEGISKIFLPELYVSKRKEII